jgi:glycosyltransferase involved in cell wall biosynthesis
VFDSRMFSLCIPTMDRFDEFLSHYLISYLDNELIQEIILTDENGNDVDKIEFYFEECKKIKVFRNEKKLGPLLNKLKAISLAQNEWVVLMDSDNFADRSYFLTAKNYIESTVKDSTNVILSPSFAKPKFNFTHLCGLVYKKGEFYKNACEEQARFFSEQLYHSEILMNKGNYVINRQLIKQLDLTNEPDIDKSSACDVIYLNTLLFEQTDLHFHVVEGMHYTHVQHPGSIYLQTINQNKGFADKVYNRYRSLV